VVNRITQEAGRLPAEGPGGPWSGRPGEVLAGLHFDQVDAPLPQPLGPNCPHGTGRLEARHHGLRGGMATMTMHLQPVGGVPHNNQLLTRFVGVGRAAATPATDADRAVIPCLKRHAPPAAELAISQLAGIGPRQPDNRECAAARWREEGHPHSRWLINHGEGTSKAARNEGASIAGFYGWGRSGQRPDNARIGAATRCRYDRHNALARG